MQDEPSEDRPAATGSLGELARRVVRTQFDAIRAHESGTREGSDPEHLHDMRVATRRLRAALKLFAEVLPPQSEVLREELAWLGRGLASVRDLDVQISQLQTWQHLLPESDRAGFEALLRLADAERAKARTELLALLASDRYRRLVATAQDVEQAPANDTSPPVEAAMPAPIEQLYRKLRKLGDRLDARSPSNDLHALRIRAKRLRYAVEFVTDIYGRPARRFLDRVVELQDLLGSHQDTQVAGERLRSMLRANAGSLPDEAVFVMGELAQRYADEALELRSRFESVYRRATGRRWEKLKQTLKARQRSITSR